MTTPQIRLHRAFGGCARRARRRRADAAPPARRSPPSSRAPSARNCRSDFMSKCSGVTPGGKDALHLPAEERRQPVARLQDRGERDHPGARAGQPSRPQPAAGTRGGRRAAAAAAAPAAAPPPRSRPPPLRAAADAAHAPQPPRRNAADASLPQRRRPPARRQPRPRRRRTDERDQVHLPPRLRRQLPRRAAGGAEAIACLQRNAGKLTPDCKTSLAALGDAMPPRRRPPPPAATRTPNAPVVMTAVIGRACMRDLLCTAAIPASATARRSPA